MKQRPARSAQALGSFVHRQDRTAAEVLDRQARKAGLDGQRDAFFYTGGIARKRVFEVGIDRQIGGRAQCRQVVNHLLSRQPAVGVMLEFGQHGRVDEVSIDRVCDQQGFGQPVHRQGPEGIGRRQLARRET